MSDIRKGYTNNTHILVGICNAPFLTNHTVGCVLCMPYSNGPKANSCIATNEL